jgi:hypothetical protein
LAALLYRAPLANIGTAEMLATGPAFSEISLDPAPARHDFTSSIDALLWRFDY